MSHNGSAERCQRSVRGFDSHRPLQFMRVLVILTLLFLSGCTTAPRLEINIRDNSRIYLLCKRTDKFNDATARYRCNGKRLLEFEMKF